MALFVAVPTLAKRYENPHALPFIPLIEALEIAEEVLVAQNKKGYHCKEARNLLSNGGECWALTYVSEKAQTYSVSVYANRWVRHGKVLPYPYNPKKDLQQLPPRAPEGL